MPDTNTINQTKQDLEQRAETLKSVRKKSEQLSQDSQRFKSDAADLARAMKEKRGKGFIAELKSWWKGNQEEETPRTQPGSFISNASSASEEKKEELQKKKSSIQKIKDAFWKGWNIGKKIGKRVSDIISNVADMALNGKVEERYSAGSGNETEKTQNLNESATALNRAHEGLNAAENAYNNALLEGVKNINHLNKQAQSSLDQWKEVYDKTRQEEAQRALQDAQDQLRNGIKAALQRTESLSDIEAKFNSLDNTWKQSVSTKKHRGNFRSTVSAIFRRGKKESGKGI